MKTFLLLGSLVVLAGSARAADQPEVAEISFRVFDGETGKIVELKDAPGMAFELELLVTVKITGADEATKPLKLDVRLRAPKADNEMASHPAIDEKRSAAVTHAFGTADSGVRYLLFRFPYPCNVAADVKATLSNGKIFSKKQNFGCDE
jgi:hypothetical protein